LHPRAEKQAITAPKTVPKRLVFLRQGLLQNKKFYNKLLRDAAQKERQRVPKNGTKRVFLFGKILFQADMFDPPTLSELRRTWDFLWK